MNFALPETAENLSAEVDRWVNATIPRSGQIEAFNDEAWRGFAGFGLLDADSADFIHRSVGFMSGARHGLPGPVLEAFLATRMDSSGQALELINSGSVVTSVQPSRAGATLVGWGAVAQLVIDQTDGTVASLSPLPRAKFAYEVPHGWFERTVDAEFDPMEVDRWILASALIAGLAEGALSLTVEHTINRQQFGRSLASFQAVQFPLAECKIWSDGLRLAVLDSASRADASAETAPVSAALTWLLAGRCAAAITKACSQSFGALGFCNEAGLVQLTWGMSWLKRSVGTMPARRLLSDRRRRAAPDISGCLVLESFE